MKSLGSQEFFDKAKDDVGRFLMEEARDSAIRDWYKILEGKMHDARGEAARQVFSSLDESARAVIKELVARVATTTLHHLLWGLEQTDDLALAFETAGNVANLKEISDGLPGELYGAKGWIARFGKEGTFVD